MDDRKAFWKGYLFLPLALAAFLYLSGLTNTDLWTPDEPRYAEAAREMLERGNYIQPYCNGEPYTEKPPLFFWLIAGCAKVFGEVNQVAVRLPSALSALGTVILLIVFVNEFFGRRAAFLSGLLLCTSPGFVVAARLGRMDMLLTFIITASLVSFYRWEARGGWGYLVIFYACLALATLTKGPIGMALPLMVVVFFALIRGGRPVVRRMHLYIGLPLVLGVVLLWYVPAMRQAAGYGVGPMLARQVIGRMFDPTSHEVSVFYWPFFHVVVLAWGMAPWSFLVPWAVMGAYRSRREAPEFFLLCWAGVIFAFFTLIAAKREVYTLPMYPAAAAMIGLWVGRSARSPAPRAVRIAAAAYGAVLLNVGVAAIVLAPTYFARNYPEISLEFKNSLLPICGAMGVAAIAAALFGRSRNQVIGVCVVASVVSFTTLIVSVLPWVNEYKSPRHICNAYSAAREAGSEIAMFGRAREEYVFYTRSHIRALWSAEEIKRFFDTDRRMFCFIQERYYRRILSGLDFPVHVIAKERVSSRVMMLVSNQNVSGAPPATCIRRGSG